ncbi:hypothetical protein MANES_03G011101v8 [Manihot esculenta]|uniref:Uncharacterized protein n=1 Tax=Manihot esculenta TaxID=3983 RepID=A0ACB7HYX8_MANES|nr:hypothetical protein MANES_03G011101v8 [Manihot esculenta]
MASSMLSLAPASFSMHEILNVLLVSFCFSIFLFFLRRER